jgi:hypothetical protein
MEAARLNLIGFVIYGRPLLAKEYLRECGVADRATGAESKTEEIFHVVNDRSQAGG